MHPIWVGGGISFSLTTGFLENSARFMENGTRNILIAWAKAFLRPNARLILTQPKIKMPSGFF